MMMRYFILLLLSVVTFCVMNTAHAEDASFRGLNIIMAESTTEMGTQTPELIVDPSNVMPSSTIVPVPVATDTAHKDESHGSGGLPQFNPASWASQIFWLTIIFGTFYALSSLWIVPKMSGIVTARADYISDNLKHAETLSNEAHHIKHEYESDLKSSHMKANDTINSIHEKAKARANASIAEFRQTFEADMAKTEHAIEKAQADAMQDMNKIVATVASTAELKIAGIQTDTTQAENVVKLLSDKKAKAA